LTTVATAEMSPAVVKDHLGLSLPTLSALRIFSAAECRVL
jgi:hypothetical protein